MGTEFRKIEVQILTAAPHQYGESSDEPARVAGLPVGHLPTALIVLSFALGIPAVL